MHTGNLERLSDVHIASKELFLIQGDRPQLLNWEKYGLRIGIAEGSLPSTETAEVAVVAIVGGQFVFPKNTVLVSAVYAVFISRPLLKALRLEMQHCVDISRGVKTKYLNFAIAPISSPSLPYEFSIVDGGEFSEQEWYGSINRKKFCLVCTVGTLTNGGEGGEGDQQEQQEGEEDGGHDDDEGGNQQSEEEGSDNDQEQQNGGQEDVVEQQEQHAQEEGRNDEKS